MATKLKAAARVAGAAGAAPSTGGQQDSSGAYLMYPPLSPGPSLGSAGTVVFRERCGQRARQRTRSFELLYIGLI
jgi:hypothetical protein